MTRREIFTRCFGVMVAMGRAVYAAAAEPKRLWIAEQGGHVDLVEMGAIEAAGEFVTQLDVRPGATMGK